MIRLYFNRRNEPNGRVWSLDHGTGTPEFTTEMVSIAGGMGVTQTDLSKHGPDEVSAWIEFHFARMDGDEKVMYISYDPKTN